MSDASYFLSTIDLYRGDAPGMSRWRATCCATASPPMPPITSACSTTAP